jgi:transposase
MGQERLAMRQIREILRLHLNCGKGRNAIAGSLRRAPATISDYLARAQSAGVTNWAEIESLSEEQLEERLGFKAPPGHLLGRPRDEERPLPDFARVHSELKRKGVTLELLWQEYRGEHPNGYLVTQFREHYRRWCRKLSLVMRQVHRAGEKTFVDYSGTGLCLTDPKTGEKTSTQLFVGCLGASSYTYAEATPTQALPHWLMSHARMFEFFGGVTEIVVPDQLRSAIKDPCLYDPGVNLSYHDLAVHYGTCVIPARPRKPRDKAKAEVAVQVAQRWIVAVLRNRTFHSLRELNAAIRECLDKLNSRIMRHVGKSRQELFESLDRPALQPLPPTRYEFCEWKKATVNIDYHVEFDRHYYSVHHALIQNEVWIRAADHTVEILHRGKRVASHARSYVRGKYTTDPTHRPESHRAHAEWSPERLIAWGRSLAPSVGHVVEAILEDKPHPEQGYRACLGVIRLGKKYGKERLALACDKALRLRSPAYSTLKSMLERGQEAAPLPPRPEPRDPMPEQLQLLAATLVRGKDYYH